MEQRPKPINFSQHPWKMTLMAVRRSFARYCTDERLGLEYNGFNSEAPPRIHEETGERLWFVYTITPHSPHHVWRASLTDSRLTVSVRGTTAYRIAYADIDKISFPEKKKEPETLQYMDRTIAYDIGHIAVFSGMLFEVRGLVRPDGYKDVFLWHALTAAKRDQARSGESPVI